MTITSEIPVPLLIKTDGTVEEILPKNGKKFTLEEVQSMIGYLEPIHLPDRMTMVVDEEGRLTGKPYNEAATEKLIELMGTTSVVNIVGDVLLVHQSYFAI